MGDDPYTTIIVDTQQFYIPKTIFPLYKLEK